MIHKDFALGFFWLTLAIAIFALFPAAYGQVLTSSHGTLEKNYGVGSVGFDTGDKCVSIGIKVCARAQLGAGGDALKVSETGRGKLDLGTSELYFSGSTGNASMNFGVEAGVSAWIVVLGQTFNIPIPYIGYRDFILSDQATWNPYFPNPVVLEDDFIRQELICAGVDFSLVSGEVCVEGSAAVRQTLTPSSISSSTGSFYSDGQRRTVSISCPSTTVSGIHKNWSWNGTLKASLYLTGQVSVLGLEYEIPLPILVNYPLPVGNWIATSFSTSPDRYVTFSPISSPGQVGTPSVSPSSVCINNQYCVYWNSVSGATSYDISENGGSWTDVKNVTSKCYSKGSSGNYSYRVRARNYCGPGTSSNSSSSVTIIALPGSVGTLSISPNPACVNQQYCISWGAVTGATSYEISSNGGSSWTNVGNTMQKCYSQGNAGNYCYMVRAKNSCGTGSASPSACVTVNPVPGQVSTPSISPNPVCVNTQYCISWGQVSGATSYEIRENGGGWVDIGNALSWCTSKASSGGYSYSVRAKNSCGTGPQSNPASVTVIGVPGQLGTPSISPNPVCVNAQDTLSWGQVSGATSYEISENGGSWLDVGNVLSKTYTKGSAGIFSYSVRAKNTCGSGLQSNPPASVTVNACYSVSGSARRPDTRSADGELAANFPVSLKVAQKVIYLDTTDANGDYSFAQVIAGDYRVCCLSSCPYIINVHSDTLGLNLIIVNEVDGVVLSVEDLRHGELPQATKLGQNYPNPFNPSTSIEFDLQRPGFVELRVLDVTGRQVRTLISEYLSAGYKRVEWDGCDASGAKVSSGIYFYRLKSEAYTETRKMLLLK